MGLLLPSSSKPGFSHLKKESHLPHLAVQSTKHTKDGNGLGSGQVLAIRAAGGGGLAGGDTVVRTKVWKLLGRCGSKSHHFCLQMSDCGGDPFNDENPNSSPVEWVQLTPY